MREKLKQLSKLFNRPLLDDSERSALKQEMLRFQEQHPFRVTEKKNTLLSHFWVYTFSYTHAMILFIVVSSVGVAAVSEFSVPNDPLYGIKTNINERLLLTTAQFIPPLHAKVDNVLLTRRLEEAEYLVLHREFKAHTADTLQSEITEHSDSLNTYISDSEAAGETDVAQTVRTKLDEILTKYDSVLDIIAVRQSAPDTDVIDAFMEQVIETHAGNDLASTTSPADLEEISHDVMTQYAESLLNDLQKLDFEIQQHIAVRTHEPEEFLTEHIMSELELSNSNRALAERALADKDPEQALIHLKDAVDAAHNAIDSIKSFDTENTEDAQQTEEKDNS